jgi:tetratricopeptide (TPR) repeat protein
VLGTIKYYQGKHEDAIQYYEQSIKINEKFVSSAHSNSIAPYIGLGLVYDNKGEYSKALSYYESP